MAPAAADEPQQLLAPPAVALLAVARARDGVVLARLEGKTTSTEELQAYEAALDGLLTRAVVASAMPGWRAEQGLGDEGCVYVQTDTQALIVVAAAVHRRYPERLVQAMLEELAEEVRATQSEVRISGAQAGTLTGSLKGPLRALMRKYNEPAKKDKVSEVREKADRLKSLMQNPKKYSELAKMDQAAEVHEKVDVVKGLMPDNVKRILETHVTIETLENSSTSLTSSANEFLKQSSDLRRQVEARNFRVKLMTVVVASALAVYVSLPFLGA
eukprot:CAMPEP_0115285382 /NCGR_PEP_ID=MMETSP0270-20121206/61394_1 /TAXON_ID=71861 /ORGANISM="Scrippsiella trochoidea, Strain CCMP3099" /LENGTH=271 /DNA_ID=CAMNT_0002702387 /DNA_START=54 /DNA_END=869 /DNA_ORIENTATION=-